MRFDLYCTAWFHMLTYRSYCAVWFLTSTYSLLCVVCFHLLTFRLYCLVWFHMSIYDSYCTVQFHISTNGLYCAGWFPMATYGLHCPIWLHIWTYRFTIRNLLHMSTYGSYCAAWVHMSRYGCLMCSTFLHVNIWFVHLHKPSSITNSLIYLINRSSYGSKLLLILVYLVWSLSIMVLRYVKCNMSHFFSSIDSFMNSNILHNCLLWSLSLHFF